MRPSVHIRPFIVALTTACALSPIAAQTLPPQARTAVHAAPGSLEAFLPAAAAGWTRGNVDTARATLSPTCAYTFAYAAYTNGTMRVRVTVADTAFDDGALATLANLVKIFPDDYVGLVPPATSVRRVMLGNAPAAELWDATKGDGEFTVVVDGRFVVKAEGLRLTDVATARRFVEMVDLDALRRIK